MAYAHPNYIIRPAFTPNDPRYHSEQYGPQIIRAPEAWDLTTGGEDVVIAIADSGLYFTHEFFLGALWINENDPIVTTPQQALDCFLRTRMDVLAMGPWCLERLAADGRLRRTAAA